MGTLTCTPWAVWAFVVMLLPLLLCVSHGAGIPQDKSPIVSSPVTIYPPPSPPTTPRPHCWNPEECCEYPVDSTEFDKCCKEHGCCPISCPVTAPGGVIIPSKDCNAWECCTHLEESPKHQECCKRNGCCPVCERVSSGCCYNGIRYGFRTVVQDLPEVCVQLVCAARLLSTTPFFVATITAVKTCSFNMSKMCVGCPVHHCVDESGLVRLEGEVWSPTPCVECQCREGHLLCTSFSGACPPRPHPGCIELPGPCCPTYHCEDGCFDEAGVFRPVGSQWSSNDPCQIMICTEDGVETTVIDCRPSQRPHEGCFLERVKGQCCKDWNCSRCLDDDGTIHMLHDVWQSGPCFVKVCSTTGITKRPVVCPPLGPAPHNTCYRDIMEGGCCEEWKCDGCWDGGVLHPPGSTWPSGDPCVNYGCTDEGAVMRPTDCPDFPRPHESCFEYIHEGDCCPTWNCSGCLDETGTYHPLYDEWQIDPCTTYVCHLNGITTKDVPCPPLGPAPHFTCYTGLVDGGCCKEWKCDGCYDNAGVFHSLGSEWASTTNPCELFLCLPSGVIHTITIACDPPPPLHDGCFLQSVPGECCKEWNCSGCWDDEGQFRKLGEQWMSDPCTSHQCTQRGITTAQKSCTISPRPHQYCKLITLLDECCPTWDCKFGRSSSNCYDDEGLQYESGAQWPADVPCMVNRCESGTIVTEHLKCQLEPPTDNCFKEHPEGECCPTWNCSGCVDESGNLHLDGSEWTLVVEPCVVLRCVDSQIKKAVIKCTDSPLPICFPSDQQDQCCPTWNCSGCMDEEEVFHGLGESWTYLCMTHNCTPQGILKDFVKCPDAPRPGCVAEQLPEDACCTTWRCDEPEYAPKLTNNPDCSAVQCEGPPWNADCMADTLPGKCCPSYLCSPPNTARNRPDCAGVYCRGPRLNEDCAANFSPHQCCPFFSCRPIEEPLLPKCAAVLCLSPPPNHNCTVTTPPGECCPKFDCNATMIPPPFSTTTTQPEPTSNLHSRTPPPIGKACKDENGRPKEEGEVWISSDDECRRSQCHKGIVIHHYQC